MVVKWNVHPEIKIQLEGSDIEEVEKLVYLGATVTSTGGAGEDISVSLEKAQAVFCNLTLFRLGGGFSNPPSGKIVITPTPKEL